MNLSIGADHAGFGMKSLVVDFLVGAGYHVIDRGAYSDVMVDYPDVALLVSKDVLSHRAKFGILICGSGIGMSIAANRHYGIRAALCFNATSSLLAREHNNANVLCLGSRFLSPDEAFAIIKIFVESDFSNEERHVARILKLDSK